MDERLHGSRLPERADSRHAPVSSAHVRTAGIPRSVAMSIIGHKTKSIYVDERMQRKAALRLDACTAGSSSLGPPPPNIAKFVRSRRQRG